MGPILVRFAVENLAPGQMFLLLLRFSPFRIFPTNDSYSFSSICNFINRKKERKWKTDEMWKLPESNTVSEIGERWLKKNILSFSLFFNLQKRLLIFAVYYVVHVFLIFEHSRLSTICRNAQSQ